MVDRHARDSADNIQSLEVSDLISTHTCIMEIKRRLASHRPALERLIEATYTLLKHGKSRSAFPMLGRDSGPTALVAHAAQAYVAPAKPLVTFVLVVNQELPVELLLSTVNQAIEEKEWRTT
ncbi:hypothetical protein NDU88_007653 [Pleurodeles waltl]|uniref:Uncharacterized protein n=1 Tax=Pleurodeles waltl TaxID=8319 RepID=A0AAV7RVG7_PLEWA|nr:hypothetical protein NDU88_007653 [Pleurodeles waltl]